MAERSEITGLASVQRLIRVMGDLAIDAFVFAMREEAELIMTEAKRRTPVKTGALRDSGVVMQQGQGADTVFTLQFGGPAAPYAVYVHYDLTKHHDNGQALFLESAIQEALPGLSDRIAARGMEIVRNRVAGGW